METRNTLSERAIEYGKRLSDTQPEHRIPFDKARKAAPILLIAYERGLIEGYHLGMHDAKEVLQKQKGDIK